MIPCISDRSPARKSLTMILLGAAMLTSACSGGGSPSSAPLLPPTPGVPVTPVINYNTAEYRQSYGLDAISAIAAYNAGYTGAGIMVAVIDSGIDRTNADLVGNIDANSINIVTHLTSDLQDKEGHGTTVAGVIAASRNDIGTHGVAFDAKILAINTTDPATCPADCGFNQYDIANGIDYARQQGAKIVNLSMSGVGVGSYLKLAMQNAVSAGMIIVIAAGNDSSAIPSAFARIAGEAWTNGQIIIAGATDQTNTIAAFSNQAGGGFANLFLVAPGVGITTTHLGGGLAVASGTSYSTPHISGAAAILLQKFPNLTAHDIADILFTTATDLGVTGVDDIYGRGLINLERAIAPVGAASIPTSSQVTASSASNGSPLAASAMHLGTPFGDALSASSALTHAMILDSYHRSYQMDLTTRIRRDRSLPALAAITEPGIETIDRTIEPLRGARLQASVEHRTAFADIDARYFAHQDPRPLHQRNFRFRLNQQVGSGLSLQAGSHVSLAASEAADVTNLFLTRPEDKSLATGAEDDIAVAAVQALGKNTKLTMAAAYSALHDREFQLDGKRSTVTFSLTHKWARNFDLSLDVGAVTEKGAVLGALSGGALALGDGAITRYTGLQAAWSPVATVRLFAGWMTGRTEVSAASGSLVTHISSLKTQSFRAGLGAYGLFNASDRFGFMVSQPLRVSSGTAELKLAEARDYTNDRLVFGDVTAALSPSGRQTDIEASYQTPLGDSLWMQTNIIHQLNAGHVADGPSQTLAVMRISTPF